MVVMQNYRLNKDTMAIFSNPCLSSSTAILEWPNKVLYCTRTPLYLIEEACISGGSTYNGRREAVERMLRTKSKLPIPVNPTEGLFFFPNMSPYEPHCHWFSFFHIQNFFTAKDDKTKTEIIFTDSRRKIINTSYKTMAGQICLTGLLVALIYKNIFWKK